MTTNQSNSTSNYNFTTYAGIDYSGPGATCNRDSETGIRYGVISINALCEFAHESFEADYGDPHCPKCGNPVSQKREFTTARHACGDYACHACGYLFDVDEAFSDEPSCHTCEDGEVKALLDSSNDVWVLKSPYFTYAQFCSPCAPGACHLAHPIEPPRGPGRQPIDANRCYALGHDWFENNVAPYPIYSVETGELVLPKHTS